MSFSIRPPIIWAAAWIFLTLGICQSAYSQAASPAIKQAKTTAAPPNISLYEELVEIAGIENGRIERDIKEGATPITRRRDYAAEIGISKDEEHTMLSIAIAAYDKEIGLDQQHERAIDDLFRNYGADEALSKIPAINAEWRTERMKESNELLKATVGELRDRLGEDAFAKITVFLKNGKLNGSYVNGVKVDYASMPDPCPPNNNPPTGQTTHMGCADLYYEEVFERVGEMESRNEEVVAEGNDTGKKLERFALFNDFPEDKRADATAVCVEAYREIKNSEEQYFKVSSEFSDQNVEKYGPIDGYKVPPSPQMEMIWEQRATIIEKYIFKLKQAIGDEFYGYLDIYLSKRNKISVPSVRSPHAPGFQGQAVKP